MEAVKQNGDTLEYADDSLKRDMDIIMEAMKIGNVRYCMFLVKNLSKEILL